MKRAPGRSRRPLKPVSSIAALLERIEVGPRPRVLVVGDLVADRYVFGRTDRISREAPVLIVRHEREEVRLGGAANAAWNVAVLGAQVTALGVLGDDEMGAKLEHLCAQSGIALSAIRDPALQTESKTRILAGGVNTSRQQMLRLDRGQEGELPAHVRARVAETLEDLAARHDAVLVSDYGAGVLGPETIAAACQAARAIPVTVDSRYQLHAFRGVTVAKPNEPELAAATQLPIGTAAQVEKAARALVRNLACEAALVTRGREGMVLCTATGSEHLAPHGARDAVDVTGAGDSVIATFTTFLAAGGALTTAARLANVAGGLVVQKPGTAAVTLTELRHALE
ncbi:MAG: bifunctional hydroxymethylpyrimidine kinase/phosphomethylpyrimidine kinase [Deltaproteobacteria bacterium]|nr:bifunctional hydroxymethylpyrimidine kinase/phosphomethylpyrimidine kinase [Deltaproteobacteria bacterium]